MDRLEGRTAFVTGGASGIGLAMARSFAAAGMKVVIADVEAEALDAAVATLRDGNADVLGIRLDVRDRQAMARAADEAEAAFGPVHLLCNNAGVGSPAPIQELAYGDWDWTLEVNVDGVVNGIQTFLPRMLAHGEGAHVVNTASMAGILGVPGLSAYNASKFAVVGLSESMAADLAGTGVGVSVLCPGFVNTQIFHSDRNRPADVDARGLADDERAAFIDTAAPELIEPAQVAEQVLEAVQADRFWIFTHGQYAEVVRERMESMLAAFPPAPEGAAPPGALQGD